MFKLPRRLLMAPACVLAVFVTAEPAVARSIPATVQDDALFLHGTDEGVREGMRRARELGFERVRLTAGWSVIAPHVDVTPAPEFDATDPAAYPAGAWDNLDRAVRAAHAAGVAPMIDIAFWAPRWATQEPNIGARYRHEIDPARFAEFATAVARRYAGGYAPPAPAARSAEQEPAPAPAPADVLGQLLGKRPPPPPPSPPAPAPVPEPLPAVDLFTLWNEPNHAGFLRPQWRRTRDGWRARSPHLYRSMVQAAYPAVKAVAPNSRVLIGATAAMGSSEPGGGNMTPGRFLRELACVDARLQPMRDGECASFRTVPGDGWSHHPYSLRTTPDVDPADRDKLPVAGTPRLAKMLQRLVAGGRLAAGNEGLYITEYGYETNEPDPTAKFPLARQASLLAWAESLVADVPNVRMWAQFQLYDRPAEATSSSGRAFSDWQSGLYYADGRAKPAAADYGRPVFSRCVKVRGRRWVSVWGRLRGQSSATVSVERIRGGAWSAVASAVRAGGRKPLARQSVRADAAAGVRRFVRHRRGTRYRLRWQSSAGAAVSAVSQPVRC